MTLFNIISSLFPKRIRIPDFSEIPDRPIGFGFKCSWLAIKTENTTEILEAFASMRISNKKTVNWKSAFQEISDYNKNLLFITPPVNKWSFVFGNSIDSWLQCPSNHMEIGTQRFFNFVKIFGKKIPTFFLFSSLRTINYTAWAMIDNGIIKRVFVCSEDELIYEQGTETQEEVEVLKYKKEQVIDSLKDWKRLEEYEQEKWKERWGKQWKEKWKESYKLPHEDDMLELASKWSINPLTLDDQRYEDNLGVGFLIKLPNKDL